MKNLRSLAAALLALAALAAAPARAETRIGFVDLQRALSEVEEGKVAKAALKSDFDEKQKKLDGKKSELDKLQEEAMKQAAVMTDAQKKAKAQELDGKAMELQSLFMQLQKDISEREAGLLRPLQEKMFALVKDIAEADGLSMVLERSAGVVWGQPSLDLTNELVRKYNAKYPPGAGKKAETPAKKAEPAAKPAAPAAKK